MDIKELYKEIILDHGKNPRNFGKCNGYNADASGHNPLCGDKVHIYAKLDKEKEDEDEKKDVKEFFDLSELNASKLEPRTMKMIDMMNDMMKFKHGSKEFKQKKAEIDNFLKKNAGK